MTPDEQIDQLLKAMTDVDAPEGMVARVQTALLAAEERPRRFPWMLPALASVAVAAVAVIALFPRHHALPLQTVQRNPAHQKSVQRVAAAATAPRLKNPSRVAHVHLVTARASQSAVNTAANENVPPPPMPLTEEERMLQRLARKYRAADLTSLTASVREGEIRRDKQAVAEFFAPPPPIPLPPGYRGVDTP
jgi:hypothetical protein